MSPDWGQVQDVSGLGRPWRSQAGHVSICGRQISKRGNPTAPAGRPTDSPRNRWQQNGASHTADLTVSDETRQDQTNEVDPPHPTVQNTPPKTEPATTTHQPDDRTSQSTQDIPKAGSPGQHQPAQLRHAHPPVPPDATRQPRTDPTPTTPTSTPNHLKPAAISAKPDVYGDRPSANTQPRPTSRPCRPWHFLLRIMNPARRQKRGATEGPKGPASRHRRGRIRPKFERRRHQPAGGTRVPDSGSSPADLQLTRDRFRAKRTIE